MVLQEAVRFFYRQHRLLWGGQRRTLLVIFQRGGRGDLLPGGQGQVWPHGALGGGGAAGGGCPFCRRRSSGGGSDLLWIYGMESSGGKWEMVRGGRDLQSTDFVGMRGLEVLGVGFINNCPRMPQESRFTGSQPAVCTRKFAECRYKLFRLFRY